MNWIARQDGLCLFFEATDEQLSRIESDPQYFRDEQFVRECSEARGDNAVVTLIISKGGSVMDGLTELKGKYATVSFWNRGHKKFRRVSK
jgi:hypothetical protein